MRLNRTAALVMALAAVASAAAVLYLSQPDRKEVVPDRDQAEPVPKRAEPAPKETQPTPKEPEAAPKETEPTPTRPRDIDEIRQRVAPALRSSLSIQALQFGSPVFIRIFKESKELEVWIAKGNRYELFRSYPICAYSGDLGPKLKEGDGQSPEGVYAVTASLLNPKSSYHLSFNLGFPNAHDMFHGRTGSFLMVHGRCVSIGCYAMTDPAIEEIYLLIESALRNGQKFVPVHVFPFRMTTENMERHKQSNWLVFWDELKAVHDAFETTQAPPKVEARFGKYVMLPN